MSYMLCVCKSLIKVDLSSFKTQNVTNMECMFSSWYNLIEVDVSSFNTENVTDMGDIFYLSKSLIKEGLSSFNTQNEKNRSNIFYYSKSLITVDLLSFNTQIVTIMNCMCSLNKSLNKIKRKKINKTKIWRKKLISFKLTIIEV